MGAEPGPPGRLRGAARGLHLGVIALLLLQCAYSAWQVFVVMRPPGARLFLFCLATDVDPAFLAIRRLYAIEGWIAVGILATYLAITEVLPRRLRG